MKPDALASAPRANLDPYEAKYMAGDAMLFRSKARTTWQTPASIGATLLFVVVWTATHGRPLVGLALGVFLALFGLFFAVIRVTVLPTAVVIQYGLLGPTIPIESIESVEAIVHHHSNPLRWGSLRLARASGSIRSQATRDVR